MERKRKREFGRTRWGETWLESLEKLGSDFANRIPRGRSYARAGRVHALEVFPGLVRARVKGRRRTPYSVEIRLKTFAEKDWENLIHVLLQHPHLVSRLLSLELPSRLEELLTEGGLYLLPQDETEFDVYCSCPDLAQPCKHIAAAFYQLSKAIDQDPFILIVLRGMEREEFLSRLNLASSQQEEEFYTPSEDEMQDFQSLRESLEGLDFSIKIRGDEVIERLLTPRPAFWSGGDFKKQLMALYRLTPERRIKEFPAELDILTDQVEWGFNGERIILVPKSGRARIRDVIDAMVGIDHERREVPIWIPEEGNIVSKNKEAVLVDLYSLCCRLNSLPLKHPGPPTFRFLLHLARLGEILERHNCLAPSLEPCKSGFRVVWEPFPADRNTQHLLNSLIQAAPLFFQAGNPSGLAHPHHWVWKFLTRYLTSAMRVRCFPLCLNLSAQFEGTSPILFFTDGELIHSLDGPQEQALYHQLKLWLEPLSMYQQKRRMRLVVKITPPQGYRKKWQLELLCQDVHDPSLLLPAKRVWKGEDLNLLGLEPLRARSQLLSSLSIVNFLIPRTEVFWDENDQLRDKVLLESRELATVVSDLLGKAPLANLTLISPPGLLLPDKIRPRLRVSSSRTSSDQGYMDLSSLLSFEWEVALGDSTLSSEEFKKLVSVKRGFLKLKDHWVILDPRQVEEIQKLLDSPPPLEKASATEKLRSILLEEIEWRDRSVPLSIPPSLGRQIFSFKKDLPLPRGLTATFRPYQARGYRWMVSNLEMGFGCCIADDMGLGKTVQVIGAILYFLENGGNRVLVVVPKTLLGNWEKELQSFASSVEFHTFHGPNRRWMDAPLVITSYATLRQDLEIFSRIYWDILVLDEAQNIKNPQAQQTRAVNALKARNRIAMTGTPLENRLLEFWSIMNFLNPGLMGSQRAFLKSIAVPIERYGDKDALRRLKRITSPFVLRRKKNDPAIAPELPEKIEKVEYTTLTPEQASLYQSIVEETMEKIEKSGGMERRGLILKLLTELKQVCDHPLLYLGHGEPSSEESGKTEMLQVLLNHIKERGEKVLLFTQYKKMGDLLVEMLTQSDGTVPLFLHGGLSRGERDMLVERFLRERRDWIFILSLKAGGTGLNLTPATHVVHFDLWWNPAVEDQATDRAHRIGQERKVVVHRFVTKGTLEEKIDEMLQTKKELAEVTISVGEKWITEMSNRDLEQLVALTQL